MANGELNDSLEGVDIWTSFYTKWYCVCEQCECIKHYIIAHNNWWNGIYIKNNATMLHENRIKLAAVEHFPNVILITIIINKTE